MANISLRHCKWQNVPPLSQRKLPQMQSQLPSILLGTAQRSLSSDKVYSTASAQEEEQKKCQLKMLRGHGHCWPRPSTNTALMEHISAWPLLLQPGWQADRQTDRQADRQTRQTDRQAGGCWASWLLQLGWGKIKSASSPRSPVANSRQHWRNLPINFLPTPRRRQRT